MNKKEKKERFYTLLHTMRKHYESGVHTWGYCSNDCGASSRGSGLCAECCEDEIDEITGIKGVGYKLRHAIVMQSIAITEIEEKLK